MELVDSQTSLTISPDNLVYCCNHITKKAIKFIYYTTNINCYRYIITNNQSNNINFLINPSHNLIQKTTNYFIKS